MVNVPFERGLRPLNPDPGGGSEGGARPPPILMASRRTRPRVAGPPRALRLLTGPPGSDPGSWRSRRPGAGLHRVPSSGCGGSPPRRAGASQGDLVRGASSCSSGCSPGPSTISPTTTSFSLTYPHNAGWYFRDAAAACSMRDAWVDAAPAPWGPNCPALGRALDAADRRLRNPEIWRASYVYICPRCEPGPAHRCCESSGQSGSHSSMPRRSPACFQPRGVHHDSAATSASVKSAFALPSSPPLPRAQSANRRGRPAESLPTSTRRMLSAIIMVWRGIAQWRDGRRAQQRSGLGKLVTSAARGELPARLAKAICKEGPLADANVCPMAFSDPLVSPRDCDPSQEASPRSTRFGSDQVLARRLADSNTLPQSARRHRHLNVLTSPATSRRSVVYVVGNGTSLLNAALTAIARCGRRGPIVDQYVSRPTPPDGTVDVLQSCGTILDAHVIPQGIGGCPRMGHVLVDPTRPRWLRPTPLRAMASHRRTSLTPMLCRFRSALSRNPSTCSRHPMRVDGAANTGVRHVQHSSMHHATAPIADDGFAEHCGRRRTRLSSTAMTDLSRKIVPMFP